MLVQETQNLVPWIGSYTCAAPFDKVKKTGIQLTGILDIKYLENRPLAKVGDALRTTDLLVPGNFRDAGLSTLHPVEINHQCAAKEAKLLSGHHFLENPSSLPLWKVVKLI